MSSDSNDDTYKELVDIITSLEFKLETAQQLVITTREECRKAFLHNHPNPNGIQAEKAWLNYRLLNLQD